MFLKPKPGVLVRDEQRRPLPENGKEVQPTPFWLRRLADGDVVLGEVPKSTKPAKGTP